MTTSILEFAKSFENLKARLGSIQSSPIRLILLIRFGDILANYLFDSRFRTYVVEFSSYLLEELREPQLDDLLIPELKTLVELIEELKGVSINAQRAEELKSKIKSISEEYARKCFFVGEIEEGLKSLCRSHKIAYPKIELSGREKSLSEFEQMRKVNEQLKKLESPLSQLTGKILEDWETARTDLLNDVANCLFVETAPENSTMLGRLLKLSGAVGKRNGKNKNDEVTFENQLVSTDDPFAGSVYDALKAVKLVVAQLRYGKGDNQFYAGRYGVSDAGGYSFTGDSIGLAAGLIAYTQILEPLMLRYERFITGEAAFTGGIEKSGKLLPVNERTLALKIERAFFSHVKYLVLPSGNIETAQKVLNELIQKYPRRKLHLVGADSLADVIENHNLIRPEKVCLGQFVVRRAYKYTRATKVQVPLLAILLLLLAFILFEKYAPLALIPWADKNPVDVSVTNEAIVIYNSDKRIINSWLAPCSDLKLYDANSNAALVDINGDLINEIVILAHTIKAGACAGILYCWNSKGTLVFERDCRIIGHYVNDDDPSGYYESSNIHLTYVDGKPILMTVLTQSNPARNHVRFWDANGDSLGSYVNAGPANFPLPVDVNNDGQKDLVIAGSNVRTESAVLFALPVNGATGCSPPYKDSQYDLSKVKRGNQIWYINFPQSKLTATFGKFTNEQERTAPKWESEKYPIVMITCEGDTASQVYYYLSRDTRVTYVDFSNYFYISYAEKVAGIPRKNIDWNALKDSLLMAVEYWTDSGFVTEGQLRAAGL